MENDLKHLTDTILKVLDRYERHLSKGTPPEALEPHKNIITGLLDRVKQTTPRIAPQAQISRIGGLVPDRQSRPQVIHGASDDPGAKIGGTSMEVVPTVPATDTRPAANVQEVTPDNIDQLSESLIENDSPIEPTITSAKEAK